MHTNNLLFGFELAEQMGLDPLKLRQAFRCLDREVDAQVIPGGIAVIGRRGQEIIYASGHASSMDAPNETVQLSTVYDCASLTKVVVTLPLILKLLESGQVRLDDPIALYLSEFASSEAKSLVTISQLLTHTSGFKPFEKLHSQGWTREEIVEHVLALPLQHEPGTQVVYSDLGYIVLGELAARLLAEPLEQAARTHVLQPLGMLSSGYRPLLQAAAAPASLGSEAIAPTEWDEAGQAYRIGIVHDEIAFAMGGISGHAGLFSTARDLSRYASMWLNEGMAAEGTRYLSVPTIRAALRSHTVALSTGHRGLGWVLKGDSFDASGDLMSVNSFGHTGFTGTSLYVDPDYGLTITLLTNRVHYGRSKSVAGLRGRFHNAVAASLTGG